MKLVDVAEFYSEQGGGVRTYIDQKLAASATLGHETVILAPGPEDRVDARQGGRIVWLKSPVEPLDPRYHRFKDPGPVHAALDREAPDLVEGSSPWAGGRIVADWPGPAPRAFFIHQDPVAVYPHTFLDRRLGPDTVDRLFFWFWRYLRRLNNRYDTSIVSGQWLADRLARFGLAHLHAVPLGVRKDAFSPGLRDLQTRRAMLAACGLDGRDDALLLISVSRHHPEKRVGPMIEAVARLNRRRPVGLYLIGDGPFRKRIDRLAAKVPQVHVAGYLRDRAALARALASADAMLHGSAAETFGLVLAEALASGLPLVVPDRGGAADLADPTCAETYRPGDPADCAAAVMRLVARDRAELSAAAARAAAERVHSPEDHFRALFAHYDTVIAGSGRAA
ncbi:glycosyltransferase [Rhodothalassium salexigens]|uniref:glycosyltransferase n=1 Tax=Rhodothalassium salexigens TaxID=1086 RepID=UPI0019118FFA|nr:glycosyltransferase [Rhodothalassium salexigens]MBK5910619.1 glycosyltransferase [Rhodothalassium salexigens]MBK5920093.1 glycosyltransferase [Rhodothalassium salexigens]